MGNNMGGGGSKAAKVMKINGEFFKLRTPAKVLDVIKDYPDHVLLDSEEFLRLNLRASPLDPEDELKPKRIYLLVELPKFPSLVGRVRSCVNASTVDPLKMAQRSVSDLSMTTESTDCNEGGPIRLKMRLPKAQVDRVVKEGGDQDEIAQRIIGLCLEEPAARRGGYTVENGLARGEGRESVEEAAAAMRGGNNRRSYPKLAPVAFSDEKH